MSGARVVVAHGDPRASEAAARALARIGEIEVVDGADAVLRALADGGADLVVVEHAMTCGDGRDLLERVGREFPGTAVLVVARPDDTGGDDPEGAVASVRAGADGYVAAATPAPALFAAAERALAARALARENARLQQRLAALESCRRLLRCLDPATVYAVALDLLLDATGRERGLAHFRRPSLPRSDGLVFRGFSRTEAQAMRQAIGRAEPIDHQLGGRPGVVADGPLHADLRELGVADAGAKLVTPLSGQEREAGVLYVFDQGSAFTAAELEHAGVIADHGQVALDNAERYHGAKARALVDDATGLHNIRYLLDSADHEIERASRYGLELSVLFIDIDRFKRVNDAHGHLIGTGTLRHVAERLQDCVRQIDTLARYGGDEFTILLTDTSPEAARIAAERIRGTIAGSVFDDGQGCTVTVTVSIGVACYPHDSRRRDELVDLADKAMYRAKSLGRDRVALIGEADAGDG